MEKEILASFKKDEMLDIEKVIECYNSYIYKILKNSIQNNSDIEEVLSDVFTIFWKNYKRLDDNTVVKPYLIGITKNLIKKKYRDYSESIDNIELYENDILYNINVEELAENEEKSKIIQSSLRDIKDDERKIFMMFYYNQKKVKEISEILKMSEAKIKIVLHRVRKFIKKNLKERGYSYGE